MRLFSKNPTASAESQLNVYSHDLNCGLQLCIGCLTHTLSMHEFSAHWIKLLQAHSYFDELRVLQSPQQDVSKAKLVHVQLADAWHYGCLRHGAIQDGACLVSGHGHGHLSCHRHHFFELHGQIQLVVHQCIDTHMAKAVDARWHSGL